MLLLFSEHHSEHVPPCLKRSSPCCDNPFLLLLVLLLFLQKIMLTLLLSALLGSQTLAAMMEVRVPELPVVALHGADATLDCSFGPPGGIVGGVNLSQLSVFWQLTDTKRSVHGYREGNEQLADQAVRFANRTALRAPPRLAAGDASLLLRRVEVADEGSYTCFVSVGQNYSSASLLLLVAAPYTKPAVTLEPPSNNLRPGERVALTCESHGGFPEAQVLWREDVGGASGGGVRNLTHNVSTSLVANERGLFSVRSVLTLRTLEPDSTYSCLLTNPLLGEEGLASVTITAQNMAFPPVALWVTVGLAVCLLALLVALAVVCRRKIKESCEEARREAEEAKELEEEESKTAMTPLKS